jgi:hypothetical protein
MRYWRRDWRMVAFLSEVRAMVLRRTIGLLACLWVGLVWAWPSAAHGGGVIRIAAASLGPYQLSVWTAPEPPRVGRVHVTVGLAAATDGAPVTGETVHVTAYGPEGAAPVRVMATHEGALVPVLYEADLFLPTPGAWRFEVDVAGVGSADFSLQVGEAAPNWPLYGLIGVAVVVGGWVVMVRGRRQPSRRRRTAAPERKSVQGL